MHSWHYQGNVFHHEEVKDWKRATLRICTNQRWLMMLACLNTSPMGCAGLSAQQEDTVTLQGLSSFLNPKQWWSAAQASKWRQFHTADKQLCAVRSPNLILPTQHSRVIYKRLTRTDSLFTPKRVRRMKTQSFLSWRNKDTPHRDGLRENEMHEARCKWFCSWKCMKEQSHSRRSELLDGWKIRSTFLPPDH